MCTITGEPTVEEKAKLLIEALKLGSPSTLYSNISTPLPISRRSISAICGTPSCEICHSSKCQYVVGVANASYRHNCILIIIYNDIITQ